MRFTSLLVAMLAPLAVATPGLTARAVHNPYSGAWPGSVSEVTVHLDENKVHKPQRKKRFGEHRGLERVRLGLITGLKRAGLWAPQVPFTLHAEVVAFRLRNEGTGRFFGSYAGRDTLAVDFELRLEGLALLRFSDEASTYRGGRDILSQEERFDELVGLLSGKSFKRLKKLAAAERALVRLSALAYRWGSQSGRALACDLDADVLARFEARAKAALEPPDRAMDTELPLKIYPIARERAFAVGPEPGEACHGVGVEIVSEVFPS